jgi:hypothetical protein
MPDILLLPELEPIRAVVAWSGGEIATEIVRGVGHQLLPAVVPRLVTWAVTRWEEIPPCPRVLL